MAATDPSADTADKPPKAQKTAWSGQIIGVQPRIKMRRQYGGRDHNYPGYVLWLRGSIGAEQRAFVVAIGKGAHAKHQFRIGDTAEGLGLPVANPETEIAELYKVSGLKVSARNERDMPSEPPFLGLAPELKDYRARGHRRLDEMVFLTKCGACRWGAEMVVECLITPGSKAADAKELRRETHCYGPKSCASYASGPAHQIPTSRGEWELESERVDVEETSHRKDDD